MSFLRPGNYAQVGESDFNPPTYGGPVAVKYATITTSGTATQNLFTLEAGAVITGVVTNVAASVVGTDAGLNLGYTSAGTFLASKVAVGTLNDQITSGYQASGLFATPFAQDRQMTAQVVGTNIAGGTLDIAITYMLRDV